MSGSDKKWVDIPGYEGFYQITKLGEIKSLYREFIDRTGKVQRIPGRIKSSFLDTDGYKVVRISKRGKTKLCKVHRLVAMTFLQKPEGRDIINHKDGNKTNNNVDNLEWVTVLENNLHSWKLPHNLYGRGSRLSDDKVRLIYSDYMEGLTPRQLSEKYGIVHGYACSIVVGRSHIPLYNLFRKEIKTFNKKKEIVSSGLLVVLQFRIVELLWLDGKTRDEIVSESGISEMKVRRYLRACIQKHGEGKYNELVSGKMSRSRLRTLSRRNGNDT